jgi:ATP-dependent DNA ligase
MANLSSLPVDLALEPMGAKVVAELPDGPGWQYEPKWDGFRCLAFKAGDEVELMGRSGKSLARFFPDMVAAVHSSFSSATPCPSMHCRCASIRQPAG